MTVSTSPTHPVAGSPATFSVSGTGSSSHVFELTARPTGSDHTLGLLTKTGVSTGRTAQSIADAADQTDTWTPDVAGVYTFSRRGYSTTVAMPTFGGDDAGTRSYLNELESFTIDVGDYVELSIQTERGFGATLQLLVVANTIREAALVDHLNEPSRIAASTTAVVAALAAMVGQTITNVGSDLATAANDLRTKFEAHRVLTAGSVHASADSVNTVTTNAAVSQAGAVVLVNELRADLVGHFSGSKLGAGSWHTADDTKNLPVAGQAFSVAQATVLLADLRERCYERHRVQTATPTVHGAADNTNALTAPTKLDDTIVAYLDEMATAAATVSAQDPQGLATAASRLGFRLRLPTL